MRALLSGGSFKGRFYAVDGPLEPLPVQPKGPPPLWVGSWGSDTGLGRAVRLGDDWLASAHNITPEQFGQRWRRVRRLLDEPGRDPAEFANGLATMWFHIVTTAGPTTYSTSGWPRSFSGRLSSSVNAWHSGRPRAVTEKLIAFRDNGVQRQR
jgi:alkanesulfonate monooxygenase SsuD/methylene tetrahydromethanopterin reductase-like flavin-dependent oxidoreductase (luciferase family)